MAEYYQFQKHLVPVPHPVFKRLGFKFELSTGAPPGTQFACTENGWIRNDVFVQWLKYFIQTTKPSQETKVLLLLDGNTTHTKKNFKLSIWQENGVILLSFPAHTTHRLQPLDVGFLKPLSVYFNQACDKWMRQHPMRKISELLGQSYGRAASVANAVTEFARTGVWPVDPNVFEDRDFAASIQDFPFSWNYRFSHIMPGSNLFQSLPRNKRAQN
jgi:hypothetical protein